MKLAMWLINSTSQYARSTGLTAAAGADVAVVTVLVTGTMGTDDVTSSSSPNGSYGR